MFIGQKELGRLQTTNISSNCSIKEIETLYTYYHQANIQTTIINEVRKYKPSISREQYAAAMTLKYSKVGKNTQRWYQPSTQYQCYMYLFLRAAPLIHYKHTTSHKTNLWRHVAARNIIG